MAADKIDGKCSSYCNNSASCLTVVTKKLIKPYGAVIPEHLL